MTLGGRRYLSERAQISFRIAGAVMAALGLAVIARDVVRGQVEQAGSVGDLSGGIVTLIGIVVERLGTLLGQKDPSTYAQVEDAASSLVGEIRVQWSREAARRGIQGPGIAELCWGLEPEPEASVPTAPAGSREDYMLDKVLRLYQQSPGQRLLITGPPGSGKSTMLILLTFSLTRGEVLKGPIPVILTLGTWDPSKQNFQQWILRRLRERYPSLRRSAYGSNALEQLLDQNRILLLLDGLDELRIDGLEANKATAKVLSKINESWPASRPLVIASRADGSGESDSLLRELGDTGQHASLMPLSPGEALRYISYTGSEDRTQQKQGKEGGGRLWNGLQVKGRVVKSRWLDLVVRVTAGPRSMEVSSAQTSREGEMAPELLLAELSDEGSKVGRILRLPFYAYLARETFKGDLDERLGELKEIADSGRDVGKVLVSEFVTKAFKAPKDMSASWGDHPAWGTDSVRRELRDIASLAQVASDNNIAWWRFQSLVPVAVWAACIGITGGIMYWLTGDLPSGLRRGAPLGFTLSIAIGLTRGTVKGPRAGVISAIACAPIIFATGLPVVGFWQALEDAAELSLAVGLGTAMLDAMFSSWSGLVKVGGLIAAITGIFAGSIQAIQDGLLSGIERFLNTGLGACEVIAIPGVFSVLLSLAWLADQPNSMSFSFRGRSERLATHLLIGVATGVAIGVGGGIEASVRYREAGFHGSSAEYGLHVAVSYALSVGIGMGIVGGLVRWLSLPTEKTSVVSPLSTLRAARAAALICVAVPPVVASVAILALNAARFDTPGAIVGRTLHLATAFSSAGLGIAIGLVFATALTAYPAYVLIQAWEMLISRGGPRLFVLMAEARERDLLRREGGFYQFRHADIQAYLADPLPVRRDGESTEGTPGKL
jgi:energy-coupling factor transporter ATP-binding protein EcfA2